MEQALWLVLGIALMRDRSILHVADALDLALPAQGEPISSSALSQARQRLGHEPLQWLFQHTAAQWANQQAAEHRWRGLSLYALDGVVWFYSAGLLWPPQHRQARHWLIPARAGLKGEVVQTHGPGDVCLRMKVSPQARKKDPGLPLTWDVRAITRELGGRQRTILTSLAEPTRWPAEEVFALYHERWEIELAYGEIKTDMLRQAMTLRSQHPEGGEQELWATLLMYNLIRLEMRQNIRRFVLTPRRSARRYPRAGRMTKTHYPIKKNAAQA